MSSLQTHIQGVAGGMGEEKEGLNMTEIQIYRKVSVDSINEVGVVSLGRKRVSS